MVSVGEAVDKIDGSIPVRWGHARPDHFDGDQAEMEHHQRADAPDEHPSQGSIRVAAENDLPPVSCVVILRRVGDLARRPARQRPCFSNPPPQAHTLNGFASEQERYHEQNQEHREQNFRKPRRHTGQPREPQERRNQRDDQKRDRPT